jgi:hypothetical protein
MGLSVIGAGFGRTGTLSLKLGLEQLGFGPCHHMGEIFAHPEQLLLWQAAVAGEAVDWDVVLAGYKSCTDFPSGYFWRELSEFYPDAKIVLTMRPVESWWRSYSETILKAHHQMRSDAPGHIQEIRKLSATLIGEKTFGSAMDDKEAGFSAYRNYVESVIAAFSSDRLLCFDVRDGWEPLCNFLGKAVPDTPFPRTNSSADFWENFG